MVNLCLFVFLSLSMTKMDTVLSRAITQNTIGGPQGKRVDTSQTNTRNRNRINSPLWNPTAWLQPRDAVTRQRVSGTSRVTTTRYDGKAPFQTSYRGRYQSRRLNHRNPVKSTSRLYKAVPSRKHTRSGTIDNTKRRFRINLKLNRIPKKNKNSRNHNIKISTGNPRHRIHITHSFKPYRKAITGKSNHQTTMFNTSPFSKQNIQLPVKTPETHFSNVHKQSNRVDLHTGSNSRTVNDAAMTSSMNPLPPVEVKSKIGPSTKIITKAKDTSAEIQLNIKNQFTEITSPDFVEAKTTNSVQNAPPTSAVNSKFNDAVTQTSDLLREVTTEEPDTPDGTELPEIESR